MRKWTNRPITWLTTCVHLCTGKWRAAVCLTSPPGVRQPRFDMLFNVCRYSSSSSFPSFPSHTLIKRASEPRVLCHIRQRDCRFHVTQTLMLCLMFNVLHFSEPSGNRTAVGTIELGDSMKRPSIHCSPLNLSADVLAYMYTLCPEKRPPFICLNNSVKTNYYFHSLWNTKFWINLTYASLKLPTIGLHEKITPHYLVESKKCF